MSRPRDADSAETWDRIVRAAREELFERGGSQPALSMRKVAARAGVSVGSIQYYFASKESLLEACLDEYYAGLTAVVEELARTLSDVGGRAPRALVEDGVRRLYRFVLSERAHLRLRAATNAERGGLHPDRARQVRSPYLDQLAPMLAPLLAIDVEETRLTIQTMTFVMMQYALLTDADVAQIAGASGAEGRRRIEDHVVRVALRLVFPGAD